MLKLSILLPANDIKKNLFSETHLQMGMQNHQEISIRPMGELTLKLQIVASLLKLILHHKLISKKCHYLKRVKKGFHY